jgi:two-component system sensor histidine kinase PilS (NtrC family)
VKGPADIERTTGDPELAWRVLGLLNLYRLSVPSVLTVLLALASRPHLQGPEFSSPYFYTLAAWFATGVICIGLLKRHRPSLGVQAFIHIAFDVVAVTLLLATSAGVASGMGLLLIMPVAAVSLLMPNRAVAFVAAIAALLILLQQLALSAAGLAPFHELTQAGLLGAVIFIAALAAAPLARRLRESEALVRQRDIDLANLAELSQYVVERLRESLVVVDEQDRVRLINESARQILGNGAGADALLGEVSPRLLYLLTMWRQGPADVDSSGANLLAADGNPPALRPTWSGAARTGSRFPGGPDRTRQPHPADPPCRARAAVGQHRA